MNNNPASPLSLYPLFEKITLKELENAIISAANSEEKNFYRTLFNLKLQLEQEKVIDQPLF